MNMLPYRQSKIAQAAEYARDLIECQSQDLEDAVIEAAHVYRVSLVLLRMRLDRMNLQ